jgi:hypothetical protein
MSAQQKETKKKKNNNNKNGRFTRSIDGDNVPISFFGRRQFLLFFYLLVIVIIIIGAELANHPKCINVPTRSQNSSGFFLFFIFVISLANHFLSQRLRPHKSPTRSAAFRNGMSYVAYYSL